MRALRVARLPAVKDSVLAALRAEGGFAARLVRAAIALVARAPPASLPPARAALLLAALAEAPLYAGAADQLLRALAATVAHDSAEARAASAAALDARVKFARAAGVVFERKFAEARGEAERVRAAALPGSEAEKRAEELSRDAEAAKATLVRVGVSRACPLNTKAARAQTWPLTLTTRPPLPPFRHVRSAPSAQLKAAEAKAEEKALLPPPRGGGDDALADLRSLLQLSPALPPPYARTAAAAAAAGAPGLVRVALDARGRLCVFDPAAPETAAYDAEARAEVEAAAREAEKAAARAGGGGKQQQQRAPPAAARGAASPAPTSARAAAPQTSAATAPPPPAATASDIPPSGATFAAPMDTADFDGRDITMFRDFIPMVMDFVEQSLLCVPRTRTRPRIRAGINPSSHHARALTSPQDQL